MSVQLSMTWPQYLRKECTFNGEVVKLGYRSVEIVALLLMRYPYPTDIETILSVLYPNWDDEPPTVRIMLNHHRRKLNKKLGGIIKTIHGGTNLQWSIA